MKVLLINGSPVHYAAASGNMTAFMDRLFYSAGRTFYMKPAACVLSARRAGTTAAFSIRLEFSPAFLAIGISA